ncbi:hypothetical protein ROHU_002317 [Labeo rohita]|uniref:Uncharacterized protein n=1 Tax=Labeo rohita TaxID=84645 RepID=A0A498NYX2_LABRO|nr:hypothetical protein ROHU_002317 [Labeo rohita]
MKFNEEYDLYRNNSLHFALRLLKLQPEPLPERDSKSTKASGSQIQDDDVEQPPMKNDEEDQSLLKII